MKRYIAFMYGQYYPEGGWQDVVSNRIDEQDVVCSWDTLEEATGAVKQMLGQKTAKDGLYWADVVDLQIGEIVEWLSNEVDG